MWKELDLENSKINMSKVSPYTENLDTFERKQAFYHNGRLTPLKNFQGTNPSNYICYKRKAGERYNTAGEKIQESGYMIDNESTDYIEVNYKDVNENLIHLIDISDTFYKVEPTIESGNSTSPDFEMSIYLNGYYLGKESDYKNCTFYEIIQRSDGFIPKANLYFIDRPNINYYTALWRVFDDKKWESEEMTLIPKSKICCTKTEYDLIFMNIDDVNFIKTNFFEKWIGKYFNIKNETNIKRHLPYYRWKSYSEGWVYNGGTEYQYDSGLYFTGDNYNYFEIGNIENRKFLYLGIGSDIAITVDQDLSTSVITGSVGDLIKGKDWRGSDAFVKTYVNFYSLVKLPNVSKMAIDSDLSKFFIDFVISGYDDKDVYTRREISTESLYQKKLINVNLENYINDSVFTDYQDFVVNYTNKKPVSIGHRYKMLMRLDTTNASYLKSDNTGVYVNQNGNKYKISLSKMFPNSDYNTQVNLIDNNTYCGQVGGYLIFNTTSYFNAVFNNDPQKIICSCDDWNGRYISKTSSYQECNLKAVSRVGHFWNADSSQIPSVAISDELVENMDLFEFYNPTYEWSNPQYKIHPVTYDYIQHPQTVAYIYKQTDTTLQVNTMYENVKITSEGFSKNGIDPTRVFVHNNGIQIIPSLLFTTFYNSDVKNYIQIGVEVFELLKYSTYSLATPALVVDSENPVNIDVSQGNYPFVIQGSYYFVTGASSARKIFNSNDLQNYACDVTGLEFIGYDSRQAYFFSSATGIIYTFNGANKLNSFVSVDKRTPLKADGKNIKVCNIPSMNIVCLGFIDGCLVIIEEQVFFIEIQGLAKIDVNAEQGLILINDKYYTLGTNTKVAKGMVGSDFILETSKIGVDRKTNITCKKHRVCFYCENPNSEKIRHFTITITSRLGDKILTEKFEKKIEVSEFIDNEFQYEFTPKYTKANWFKIKIEMSTNLDLLNYYLDINDNAEENIIR